MSNLPSRLGWDSAIRHLKERGNKSAAALIEAYASGRLFDREAIDYEAAGRRLEPLLSWPDDDVKTFAEFALKEGSAIVDAAIEGSE